jgi:uncharacterized protein YndB with AHSA1/START domain
MNEPSVFHSTFSIEKTYPVTPEKVFAAFADPVKKRRWMGGDADGFEIESFEMNFQVDHHERWRFRFQGGPLIKTDTCFQDIVPNRRIVFVYTMTFDGKRGSSSQTTVEFLPGPKGTTLLFTEQGAFFDGAGAESAKGREEGTRGLFEQLEREVLNA